VSKLSTVEGLKVEKFFLLSIRMVLNSLTLKSDFAKLRQVGKRFSLSLFSAVYVYDPELKGIRIAFALPRKLANAVKRNKIRRRIREALRLEDLSGLGHDILFIPRKSAYSAEWESVRGDIRKLLQFLRSKVR
jgi:ribonuclease P protein component